MPRSFLTSIDLNLNQLLNATFQNLAADPASGSPGYVYYNTTNSRLRVCTNATGPVFTDLYPAVPDATTTVKGIVKLAGDLAGTADLPVVAADAITAAKIAPALKNNAAAATEALRALGTTGTTAAAGNDTRLSDSRPPNGTAGGVLSGTYPNPGFAVDMATQAELDANATADRSRANHTGTQLAATISDFVATRDAQRLDQHAAPTASVNLGNQRITSLLTDASSAATDAATKGYVDGVAQGLDVKASVNAATTANITLSGGIGSPLDGVNLVHDYRVLVKNQTAPAENGIYLARAAAWVRAPDADTYSELPGAFVFVEQGTVNADTGWVCTADSATGGTIGSSALPWTQFSGAGTITAGNGLGQTGNTLFVNPPSLGLQIVSDVLEVRLSGGGATGPGLEFNTGESPAAGLRAKYDDTSIGITGAQALEVKALGITTAKLADANVTAAKLAVSAVDLATTTVTGTLPITKGGTGGTTATTARTNLGAVGKYSSATHAAGTSITITAATHGLGAGRDKQVQCLLESTGAIVEADMTIAANGDVVIGFATSQAVNTIRVTIIG